MTAPAPLAELIGPVIADLARHSSADLHRWMTQVRALGGCAEPVRLTGERRTLDATTGEVLHAYSTAGEPHGQLMVRCGNRRATRCPACAATYRADTFHLVRAGLTGGDKGVPATVRDHPRVFATLTAPSFGPVHTRRETGGRVLPCHPRRDGGTCAHGRPVSCTARHAVDDSALGQPICGDCYDYPGAVLWNAHAGALWTRFTVYLRRELAHAAGLTARELNAAVRVSFAKVAEFQRRGLVHLHAIIRLDGRPADDGAPPGSTPPPAWATVELLAEAIPAAAARVRVPAPHAERVGVRELVWGEQVDVRPIAGRAFGPDQALSERAVAGYVAKYATKAAEATGTLDRRLSGADLDHLAERDVPEHARRLIATCWELGDPARHPELVGLRLRKWAHMLGFRGHFSTKSRAYSTTLGALRAARADYRADQARERLGLPEPGEDTTLVLAHWRYAGQGFIPGESLLAATVTAPAHSKGDTPLCPDSC